MVHEVASNSLVGIEVEMEGCKVFREEVESGEFQLGYWKLVNDSSLRNHGVEMVLSKPQKGEFILRALEELRRVVIRFNPDFSQRTSVHIHIDFRGMETITVLNFIALYIILERSLAKYIGGDRDNNIFCLPFYRAESVLGTMLSKVVATKDLKPEQLMKECATQASYRYAALNVHSYSKYGSLEVRSCGGTGDTEFLLEWINILLDMQSYSSSEDFNLLNLPTTFSSSTPEKLIEDVFSSQSRRDIFLAQPTLHKDTLLGVRLAQDMIYRKQMHDASTKLHRKTISEESYFRKVFKPVEEDTSCVD